MHSFNFNNSDFHINICRYSLANGKWKNISSFLHGWVQVGAWSISWDPYPEKTKPGIS